MLMMNELAYQMLEAAANIAGSNHVDLNAHERSDLHSAIYRVLADFAVREQERNK